MKNQKGAVKLFSVIVTTILIIILINCFKIYRENYFNGFEKALRGQETDTNFVRDSKVKYLEYSSYKIENINYNDASFYKEIEVEPHTPYKISCMVKTENVVCEMENEDGGVVIGLLDTTEYSAPVTGTNDWQYVEFMFNSKNREKVKISFRLGGNDSYCKGTAWFSNFKLEKGTKTTDYNWKIGCFILNELDVNIEGKQYKLHTNQNDIENVKLNMKRFKEDCYTFSNNKMNVEYEIIEIDEPLTTISYSAEHGYYVSYKDVKNLIYEKVKQEEYDHIFVVCRMENDAGTITIPVYDNWIGLGSMDIYGIGYSLVRINKNSNIYTYKYGETNQNPEEVYIHELCHTLERNLIENEYEIPALHDNEKYGYKEEAISGLSKWYKDYMGNNVLDKNTGEYTGLDEFCYNTQPPNSSNFQTPIEIEFNCEQQNIFEEILTIFDVLTKK